MIRIGWYDTVQQDTTTAEACKERRDSIKNVIMLK